MTDQAQHPNRPTDRQLRFLEDLREQTGGTYAWPNTSAEASREIRRLLRLKAAIGSIRREYRAPTRSLAEESGDAAAVRDDELTGYGSTAGWAGRHG
jgi:hypothetical protein